MPTTIDNRAIVSLKAQIGDNVIIGPNAIIEDDVIIGIQVGARKEIR